jgi:response regulator NasT
MDGALIVSPSEKGKAFIRDLLSPHGMALSAASSAGEARRALLRQSFELAIINAPLPDEVGHELADELALSDIGVLLLIKSDMADEISARVMLSGVYVLGKPVSREIFEQTVRLVLTTTTRIARLRQENDKLRHKLEEDKLIARAKIALIEHQHMSESEAHRFIEKQAMDARTTRRDVALMLLNGYK